MSSVSLHTSRAFEDELEELRTATVAMGERCRLALRTALEAFRTGSTELASQVARVDRARQPRAAET